MSFPHFLAAELIEEGRAAVCQSCGSAGLEAFYEALAVPSHSCVLMADRESAVSFPRGDVLLGFCRRCGFIQNTRFDAEVVDYTQPYEETQGFSPRFNEFLEDLVRGLVDRHDMREKHVFEIGCGKGEFLVRMAELGMNTGLGIDPGYAPERTTSPAVDRLEFIRDFFSEDYLYLTGDLVATRHTLEHIGPVAEFMSWLRTSVAASDGVLFIEVPDTSRVLTEHAFWDIYYEHSSYFTLGSLARLMRETGFRASRLELAYGGQYLLAEGRLTGVALDGPHPAEESISDLQRQVVGFGTQCERTVDRWRTRVQAEHDRGKRTVLWGGGSKAVAFLTTLGLSEAIELVVDINPYKQGMFMPGTGQRVVGAEDLREYRPDNVIVMNPIYKEEITRDLSALGLSPTIRSV